MQPTDRSLDSPVLRGFRLNHDLTTDGHGRDAAVSIEAHYLPTVPKLETPENPSPNSSLTTPAPEAETARDLESAEIKGFRLPDETAVPREAAASFAAQKPASQIGGPNPLNPPNASASRRLKSPPAELKRGAGTTSPVLKGFRFGSDENAQTSGREPAVSFEGQSPPPAHNPLAGSSNPSPNPPSKLRQPDPATTNPVGSKAKPGRSNPPNPAPNPASNQTPNPPVGSKTGQERGSPVLKGFRLADDSTSGRDAAVSFDAPQFPAVVSPHRRLPTEELDPGSEVGLSIVLGPVNAQTPQTRSSTHQNPGSTSANPVLNPGTSSRAARSIFHRGQGQSVLPRSRLTWNDVINGASLEGGDGVSGAGGSARNEVGDDVSEAGDGVEAEGGDVIGEASLDCSANEHGADGAGRSVRESSGSDVSTAGRDAAVEEADVSEGTNLGDFHTKHDVSKSGGMVEELARDDVRKTSEDSGEERKEDVDGTEESTGEVCKRVVMEGSDVIQGFEKRKAERDAAKSKRMTVLSSRESRGLRGRLNAEDGVMMRGQGPFLGGSKSSLHLEGGNGGTEESREVGAGQSRREREEEGRTEWEQGNRADLTEESRTERKEESGMNLAEGSRTEWPEESRTERAEESKTERTERNVEDQSGMERNGGSVGTNGGEQYGWKDSHEDVNEPAISAARAFSPERKAPVSQQSTKERSSEECGMREPGFSRLPSFLDGDGSGVVSAAKAFSPKGTGLSRLTAKGALEARKAGLLDSALGKIEVNSRGKVLLDGDRNSEAFPSAEEGLGPEEEGASDPSSERTSVDTLSRSGSPIQKSANSPILEEGSARKAPSLEGGVVFQSAARGEAEEAEATEAVQKGEGRASGLENRSGIEDLSKWTAVEGSEKASVIESEQRRGPSGWRTASREPLRGVRKLAARENLALEQSGALSGSGSGSRQAVEEASMLASREGSEKGKTKDCERAESREPQRAESTESERAELRESERAESKQSERAESRDSERPGEGRNSRSVSQQAFKGAKPTTRVLSKSERASVVGSEQSGGASGSLSAGRSALDGASTPVSPESSVQKQGGRAHGSANRAPGPSKSEAVEDSKRVVRSEQSMGRPVSRSDGSKVLRHGAAVTSPTRRRPGPKGTPNPPEPSDANPKPDPNQTRTPQPGGSPKSVESGLGGNPATSDALSLLAAQYEGSPPHNLPPDVNPEPLHQPNVTGSPSVKVNLSPVNINRPAFESQRKGPSKAPASRSPPTSERPKVSNTETGADIPRPSESPRLLVSPRSAEPSRGIRAPSSNRPPVEGSSPTSKDPAELDAGTAADSSRASQSPLFSVSPRIRDIRRGLRNVTSRNPPPPSSPTKSDSLLVSDTFSESDRAPADWYLLSQPYQPGTFGEPSRPTSGGRPLSAERPPTAESAGRFTYSERPMSAERWVAPSEPETLQPPHSVSDNPPQNLPPNPVDRFQSEGVMGPHFFPFGMPPPVGHVSASHWPLVQGAEGRFSAPPAARSVRTGPVNPPGYPPFLEPHQQLLAQYMQQYPGFSFLPGGLVNPLPEPRQGGSSQHLFAHGGNSGFSLPSGGLVNPVLNPKAEAGLQPLGGNPTLLFPPGYWQTVPNSLTQSPDFANLPNPLSQSQNLPNPFGLNPLPNPPLQYPPFPNPYFSYGAPPQYFPAPHLAFPFGAGLPNQLPHFGVPGTFQGAVSGPPQQPRSVRSHEFASRSEKVPERRSEKGGVTAVRSDLLKARDIAVQRALMRASLKEPSSSTTEQHLRSSNQPPHLGPSHSAAAPPLSRVANSRGDAVGANPKPSKPIQPLPAQTPTMLSRNPGLPNFSTAPQNGQTVHRPRVTETGHANQPARVADPPADLHQRGDVWTTVQPNPPQNPPQKVDNPGAPAQTTLNPAETLPSYEDFLEFLRFRSAIAAQSTGVLTSAPPGPPPSTLTSAYPQPSFQPGMPTSAFFQPPSPVNALMSAPGQSAVGASFVGIAGRMTSHGGVEAAVLTSGTSRKRELAERECAAAKIQTLWRQHKLWRAERRRKEAPERRAGMLLMWRFRARFLHLRSVVIRLQATRRGAVARQRFLTTCRAVRTIQTAWKLFKVSLSDWQRGKLRELRDFHKHVSENLEVVGLEAPSFRRFGGFMERLVAATEGARVRRRMGTRRVKALINEMRDIRDLLQQLEAEKAKGRASPDRQLERSLRVQLHQKHVLLERAVHTPLRYASMSTVNTPLPSPSPSRQGFRGLSGVSDVVRMWASDSVGGRLAGETRGTGNRHQGASASGFSDAVRSWASEASSGRPKMLRPSYGSEFEARASGRSSFNQGETTAERYARNAGASSIGPHREYSHEGRQAYSRRGGVPQGLAENGRLSFRGASIGFGTTLKRESVSEAVALGGGNVSHADISKRRNLGGAYDATGVQEDHRTGGFQRGGGASTDSMEGGLRSPADSFVQFAGPVFRTFDQGFSLSPIGLNTPAGLGGELVRFEGVSQRPGSQQGALGDASQMGRQELEKEQRESFGSEGTRFEVEYVEFEDVPYDAEEAPSEPRGRMSEHELEQVRDNPTNQVMPNRPASARDENRSHGRGYLAQPGSDLDRYSAGDSSRGGRSQQAGLSQTSPNPAQTSHRVSYDDIPIKSKASANFRNLPDLQVDVSTSSNNPSTNPSPSEEPGRGSLKRPFLRARGGRLGTSVSIPDHLKVSIPEPPSGASGPPLNSSELGPSTAPGNLGRSLFSDGPRVKRRVKRDRFEGEISILEREDEGEASEEPPKRAFLQRKSKAMSMQKLDWSKVKPLVEARLHPDKHSASNRQASLKKEEPPPLPDYRNVKSRLLAYREPSRKHPPLEEEPSFEPGSQPSSGRLPKGSVKSPRRQSVHRQRTRQGRKSGSEESFGAPSDSGESQHTKGGHVSGRGRVKAREGMEAMERNLQRGLEFGAREAWGAGSETESETRSLGSQNRKPTRGGEEVRENDGKKKGQQERDVGRIKQTDGLRRRASGGIEEMGSSGIVQPESGNETGGALSSAGEMLERMYKNLQSDRGVDLSGLFPRRGGGGESVIPRLRADAVVFADQGEVLYTKLMTERRFDRLGSDCLTFVVASS